MKEILIVAAALSAFAISTHAAPNETPYALSAVHADFQAELERTARLPGEIGATASAAAKLMAPHNAAQESLILPLLGWADMVASGREAKVPDIPDRTHIEAELSRLYDLDVDLITALVELFVAADEAEDIETAKLAERMIWHETSDVEVLYPTALLIEAAMRSTATDG